GHTQTDSLRLSSSDHISHAAQPARHPDITCRNVGCSSGPHCELRVPARYTRKNLIQSSVSPMANYHVTAGANRLARQVSTGIRPICCSRIRLYPAALEQSDHLAYPSFAEQIPARNGIVDDRCFSGLHSVSRWNGKQY